MDCIVEEDECTVVLRRCTWFMRGSHGVFETERICQMEEERTRNLIMQSMSEPADSPVCEAADCSTRYLATAAHAGSLDWFRSCILPNTPFDVCCHRGHAGESSPPKSSEANTSLFQ